jgi:hypothetical protein
MAAPATTAAQTDAEAVLAVAYTQARNIAYARWLGRITVEEIDGLVNAAVVTLLSAVANDNAAILDVPKTTKYLTTNVDWRAKDYLRAQKRRPAQTPLPDDEGPASKALRSALAVDNSSPEAVLESGHVRDLVDELQTRIPSRVNRLIVHLFFFHQLSCSEIAETVKRLLGVELTAKAVERRKAETTKALTVEWSRALSGAHCRQLATAASGGGDGAITRYALGLLDLNDERDKHLHDIVAAHLKHCAHCRAVAVAARRDMRQLALLAAPILVGVSDHAHRTAEHGMVHAPGVFERTLDTVRSGLGRGTIRAAETLPNNGASTGEMVGSAGAGGGAALGGGLAAKVLIAGTTAVCAFGGQQLCVQLLGSHPSPKRQQAHTVALRPKFPVGASGVKAAQAQPRAGATAAQQLAHRARVAAVHRAQRRAATRTTATSSSRSPSAPPASAAPSSAPTRSAAAASSSRDPTFSPTAPTSSSSSSGGGGGSGGSSGGSGSSSSSTDSTFQGLP